MERGRGREGERGREEGREGVESREAGIDQESGQQPSARLVPLPPKKNTITEAA